MCISEFLETNRSLKVLMLGINKLKNEGIKKICVGIKKNYTIKNLDLYQNMIGEKGAKRLLDALNYNFSLFEMDLYDNNGMGKEKINQISFLLKKNKIIVKTKIYMLILRKRSNCVVSLLPRRLLVYLLYFLKSKISSFDLVEN